MAKGPRSGRRTPRDVTVIANPRSGSSVSGLRRPSVVGSSYLSDIEDARLWYPSSSPLDYPAARTLRGTPARLEVYENRNRRRSAPAFHTPSPFVGFKVPSRVVVCVRRAVRRAVMHAIGAAGSRHLKKPKRNVKSSIRC